MAQQQVLEGTWEEIALHAQELSGRRLRVIVLPEESNGAAPGNALSEEEEERLLDELARIGKDVPVHREETYSRETIYGDHD
jgi:hypothetical protein